MMGSKRVTPKIITSAQSRPSKLAPKIATLVEVLREARRKETELARLSKYWFYQRLQIKIFSHAKVFVTFKLRSGGLRGYNIFSTPLV